MESPGRVFQYNGFPVHRLIGCLFSLQRHQLIQSAHGANRFVIVRGIMEIAPPETKGNSVVFAVITASFLASVMVASVSVFDNNDALLL